MKGKTTKLHIALRVLSLLFLGGIVLGTVLTVRGFGHPETHDFMIGGIVTVFSVFGAILCAFWGFRPLLVRLAVKAARQTVEENKEDLAKLSKAAAEVQAERIKITANAAKEGWRDTAFCEHCGGEIDADSAFCKHCGKAR